MIRMGWPQELELEYSRPKGTACADANVSVDKEDYFVWKSVSKERVEEE